MTGRRRHTRFVLAAPVDGSLRIREDVLIERWGDGEVEAVSTVPCKPNEELTLEVSDDDVDPVTVTVRDSRPIVTADDSVRYRLRLSFEQPAVATTPNQGTRES
jgi:hypothetical protein